MFSKFSESLSVLPFSRRMCFDLGDVDRRYTGNHTYRSVAVETSFNVCISGIKFTLFFMVDDFFNMILSWAY